ncbi:hypothetical protein BKA80DRAFT_271996 [Phyllosticta citrichinensis]
MLLLAILSFAAVAVAIPATSLEKRACKSAYPTQHFQLISTDKQQNTKNHDIVVTGISGETEYVTELHWDGFAAGSYGCRLQLFFPKDGSGRLQTNPNNHKLNFWTVNRTVDVELDNWDNHPGKVSLVGTADVQILKPYQEDTVIEVASSGCPAAGLDYRVEIEKSGGQKEGFVQFWQENGAGLRVLYDC